MRFHEKKTIKPLDDLVTGSIRADFLEACALLEEHPRMSAVLSRRVLADLLKQYAGLDDYNLNGRINKFIEDKSHPLRLRENLHHLREIGDFSAHTMEDDQGNVVNVAHREAEWTIKVAGDLLEYFIVAPARDKLMREAMNEKIQQANRKPVKTPPDSKA